MTPTIGQMDPNLGHLPTSAPPVGLNLERGRYVKKPEFNTILDAGNIGAYRLSAVVSPTQLLESEDANLKEILTTVTNSGNEHSDLSKYKQYGECRGAIVIPPSLFIVQDVLKPLITKNDNKSDEEGSASDSEDDIASNIRRSAVDTIRNVQMEIGVTDTRAVMGVMRTFYTPFLLSCPSVIDNGEISEFCLRRGDEVVGYMYVNVIDALKTTIVHRRSMYDFSTQVTEGAYDLRIDFPRGDVCGVLLTPMEELNNPIKSDAFSLLSIQGRLSSLTQKLTDDVDDEDKIVIQSSNQSIPANDESQSQRLEMDNVAVVDEVVLSNSMCTVDGGDISDEVNACLREICLGQEFIFFAANTTQFLVQYDGTKARPSYRMLDDRFGAPRPRDLINPVEAMALKSKFHKVGNKKQAQEAEEAIPVEEAIKNDEPIDSSASSSYSESSSDDEDDQWPRYYSSIFPPRDAYHYGSTVDALPKMHLYNPQGDVVVPENTAIRHRVFDGVFENVRTSSEMWSIISHTNSVVVMSGRITDIYRVPYLSENVVNMQEPTAPVNEEENDHCGVRVEPTISGTVSGTGITEINVDSAPINIFLTKYMQFANHRSDAHERLVLYMNAHMEAMRAAPRHNHHEALYRAVCNKIDRIDLEILKQLRLMEEWSTMAAFESSMSKRMSDNLTFIAMSSYVNQELGRYDVCETRIKTGLNIAEGIELGLSALDQFVIEEVNENEDAPLMTYGERRLAEEARVLGVNTLNEAQRYNSAFFIRRMAELRQLFSGKQNFFNFDAGKGRVYEDMDGEYVDDLDGEYYDEYYGEDGEYYGEEYDEGDYYTEEYGQFRSDSPATRLPPGLQSDIPYEGDCEDDDSDADDLIKAVENVMGSTEAQSQNDDPSVVVSETADEGLPLLYRPKAGEAIDYSKPLLNDADMFEYWVDKYGNERRTLKVPMGFGFFVPDAPEGAEDL